MSSVYVEENFDKVDTMALKNRKTIHCHQPVIRHNSRALFDKDAKRLVFVKKWPAKTDLPSICEKLADITQIQIAMINLKLVLASTTKDN